MADLTATGFPGGITDDDESQNPKEYVEADNLDIEFPSQHLVTRGGSVVHNDTTPRITQQRVSNLINYGPDETLLAVSEAKLFVDNGAAGIAPLFGPGGNTAFPAATADLIACPAQYDGEVIITSEDIGKDGCKPLKIYKDAAGTLKMVTAGLPKYPVNQFHDHGDVAPVEYSTLANDIRQQFIDHFADAVRHPVAIDAASAALLTAGPLGADTLDVTIALTKTLIAAYKSHLADARLPTGNRAYHSNSLGDYPGEPNLPLEDDSDPKTWLDIAQRLNDIKKRWNWHLRAFAGHPSVGPDIVTAANILNASNGPVVAVPPPPYDPFFKLVDFGNAVKSHFNNHLASVTDAHYTTLDTGAFAGLQDTVNPITLANADSRDSLVELTCHLYAAYRAHRDDAVLKVFHSKATTLTAAGSRKHLDNIGASAFAADGYNASYQDALVGMYVRVEATAALGAVGNQFPLGTKIASIVGANALTDTDHDNFGGADQTKGLAFTLKKYHSRLSNDGVPSESALQTDASLQSASLSDSALQAVLLDIAAKFNAHDSSIKYHEVGGLYAIDLTTCPTPYSYLYAFAISREYKTFDGKTRKDISAVLYKTIVAFQPIEKLNIYFASLANWVNAASENYNTDNMRIEIYRSKNGQTTLYLTGSVANGVTQFTDTLADDQLAAKETIYTAGGVVDNDPPPIARVVHQHLGYAYYGNVKIGDDYLPNDIVQSIGEDLDSVPESFRVSLPGPVVGISSTPRERIAWTENGTFRLEGNFDELGQGAITRVPISEKVGLLGTLSPVQVDQGVLFAGNDGFYLTDGYRITPLSQRFQETYSQLVQSAVRARRIQGTYDRTNNRVIWAVAFDGDENDQMFVVHLKFGVRPDGASFTTYSGKGSFQPSAVCVFQGNLIRGDSRGYVLRHNQDYSDPFIDPAIDPANWIPQKIEWNFISTAFDFGSRRVQKYVTKIVTTLSNAGKATVQIFRINNLGRSVKELSEIVFSGRRIGSLIEKRWMPSGSLRCMFMQIQMTNRDSVAVDEKISLAAYTLKYEMLGESVSDAEDDAIEVAEG